MENPLLSPLPADPIQRIHDYARDLAYLGVHSELNYGALIFDTRELHQFYEDSSDSQRRFVEKWGEYGPNLHAPPFPTLESFGYINRILDAENNTKSYQLTQKAFTLLDKPAAPPSVFISYRHQESSTFALLIEARLQLRGGAGVFVDRDIPGGDDWWAHIQQQIAESKVFIVLLGKTALDPRSWLVKELELATNAKCRIIPIWHNGHTLAAQKLTTCPAILDVNHGYTVMEESALAYDTAVIWLLNTLGYRT
jgi:TIR domain